MAINPMHLTQIVFEYSETSLFDQVLLWSFITDMQFASQKNKLNQ